MKKIIFSVAYYLVRQWRKMRSSIKLFELRLRGVNVKSTASISSFAIIEPSGGLISIGDNTFIDHGVVLRSLGGSIVIGMNCSINAYSIIYGGGGLNVGNGVRIGAHTIIMPSNHIFSDKKKFIKDQGLSMKGIIIEDDVWIGAGARLLDGIIIKKGTVVASGAVVTKSTDSYSIVAGVPARKISSR